MKEKKKRKNKKMRFLLLIIRENEKKDDFSFPLFDCIKNEKKKIYKFIKRHEYP